MAPKTYTAAEVAKHNTPKDCWVIVNGKVYDVTAMVPRHPGGDMITIRAGADSTMLFESYHSTTAWRVLDKYCIGDLAPSSAAPGSDGQPQYKLGASGDEFYVTLKTRVEQYFKKNNLNPRWALALHIKAALLLAATATLYYYAFFVQHGTAVTLALASLFGMGLAFIGINITHDASHFTCSRSNLVCRSYAAVLDLVGWSSFMWAQQHVVGHHAFTNVRNVDPDIRVADPDVRRIVPEQSQKKYYGFQHIYLLILYGMLAFKGIFVDDFTAISRGYIGAIKLTRMTPLDSAIFWGGKVAFMAWGFALPMALMPISLGTFVMVWGVALVFAGWTLALLFQVAHVNGDVAFFRPDKKVDVSWAVSQVMSTADFCHGSWFWMHVSGGLNYQCVHHLLPGVCHIHYPALAPIVVQTCKEFGVPITVYPTFWAALAAHFNYLKVMGREAQVVTH